MKILLGLHTLFQLAITVVMIFIPFSVLGLGDFSGFENARPLLLATSRSIGFAAAGMAALSGLMMLRPLTREMRFIGAGALGIFNLLMTLAQLLNLIEGIAPLPYVIVYGVFALVFMGIFIWNK